jgi:hypothetical protein
MHPQIIIHLQPQEEALAHAVIAHEAQVCVRGHGPLAEHDFIDAARRYADSAGEGVLRQVRRLQEFFQQDFAWMRIVQHIAGSGFANGI